MSHHVYTTPGFVIDSRPNGEAGRLLYIFTKELGLVLATAQGIRLGVSKLRYHTQDFSHAVFSLVRGKEIWRLVGATAKEASSGGRTDIDSSSFVPIAATLDPIYFLRARIFSLLKRLLHGEEANDSLYEILTAFEAYVAIHRVPEEDIELVERIMVLRVLHALGYVAHGSKESTELERFFGTNEWSAKLVSEMKQSRIPAVRAINKGLKESQL
jgi:recombinational DNA repair protein (RecF pathway)